MTPKQMLPPTDLVDRLRPMAEEILGYARDFGLDPIPTVFEVVEYDEMNQIAAYGGFPTRYPHWRFGMEYEELKKGYAFGLSKIYELVINNEPCYAYLMRNNSLTDQKMVMAHVYGHSDFFRHNLWFSQTSRTMINEMANHGTRIRRYVERYGQDVVERFIDCCLSLENLVDYHSVYSPGRRRSRSYEEADDSPQPVHKLPSKGYMDKYINPPEFLEEQKRKIEAASARKKQFPERPEKDVLLFLMEYAPLENWQRDVLSMIRDEAYYFAPQALTKIMNEGWAAYWHSKMMTEKVMEDAEVIDYCEHHAGVLGGNSGAINPYKLGVELFKDIEERWDTGRFGPDYDACEDIEVREAWDTGLRRGREKIFEVRRVCNDITFIDTYLTAEFCERRKMFVYELNPQTNQYEINTRNFEKIKKTLLYRLTNMGSPVIRIVDANYKNRAELLLKHDHEGFDLDVTEGRDTLKNLYALWQRPVHVMTIVNETGKILSFNGEEHSEATVDEGERE